MENVDYFDSEEVLKHGSYPTRPRFKTALNIDKLINGAGAHFEVDVDDGEGFLEDHDEMDQAMFSELYKEQVLFKKNKNLEELFNLMKIEDICGSYEEMLNEMEKVTEDGGVVKLNIREGMGNQIPLDCKIFVHYYAIIEGHDEPYDSTLGKGIPATFKLAEADMIPGLYLALKSMKANEISKFILKPEYAFGKLGAPPRIPPNATILFCVEIVDVLSPDQISSILEKSVDERALMKFSDIIHQAELLRNEGNACYSESRYSLAVRRYRAGIRVLEDYPVITESNERERCELLFTLYINMAQCYLKLEKAPQACVACRLAIRLDKAAEGNLHKAYFRYAQAKFMLGGHEEAKRFCDKALSLRPQIKSIVALQEKIVKRIREDNINTNRLFKKMAGGTTTETKPSPNLRSGPGILTKNTEAYNKKN